MFLLRRRKGFSVRQDILTAVTFSIASWYNVLTEKSTKEKKKKKTLTRIIEHATVKSPAPLKP